MKLEILNYSGFLHVHLFNWIAVTLWVGEVEGGMQIGSSEGSRWKC